MKRCLDAPGIAGYGKVKDLATVPGVSFEWLGTDRLDFHPGEKLVPNPDRDLVTAAGGNFESEFGRSLRAFNAREGVGSERDVVPEKLFVPLQGGATDGVALTQDEMVHAVARYYEMVGWDSDGRPTRAKLQELALGWLADELGL